MLDYWRTFVMHSKTELMKGVAAFVRCRMKDIVACAQPRLTNAFLKAVNGLF